MFDPLLVCVLLSFSFLLSFSPLAPLTERIIIMIYIYIYVSDHVLKMQKGLKCISYSLTFAPGTSALLSASVFTPFPLNTFSPLYLLSSQVLASHFLVPLYSFSHLLFCSPLPCLTLTPEIQLSPLITSFSNVFSFWITHFLPSSYPSSSLLSYFTPHHLSSSCPASCPAPQIYSCLTPALKPGRRGGLLGNFLLYHKTISSVKCSSKDISGEK